MVRQDHCRALIPHYKTQIEKKNDVIQQNNNDDDDNIVDEKNVGRR